MAGRLSRRGFLGGVAGAGLLAGRPAFSAPQSFTRPEVFPVRLRQDPPHEELRPLIPAGSDEFKCEGRAVELMGALARMLESGELPLGADFVGRNPLPSGWEELSDDAAAARFNPGDGDFSRGLRRWAAAVSDVRFYPLEDGLVRFEARVGRDYHVGLWKVDWREGKLHRFEPLRETRARIGDGFTSVTMLDAEDPAARQLALGTPEWRRRLDLTCGVDVYGQNGVSVGDIDNGGWDEIYVCQPGGLPNRLLRRDADGLYRDISAQAGVDLLDHTSCALFVDFRNRGLQDLVVLTGSRPLLFVNQGDGTFKLEANAFRFANAPRGAFTGMAAADYDGDGFVDLYLCTYIYFQSEDQYSYPAPYHDARNGPPNFLFRNRLAEGGGFEDVTERVGLGEHNDRYSFAPAWCDYDFDGRPELYVANDFGRNNLYKFDGVRFRDIAAEAGVEDLGPGMSAAWFDAHRSGRPDLYVTNMWTAAGRRVTHDPAFKLVAEKGLAEEYRRHTKGNSLYRNRGDGTFEETGEAEMGRWSWSGDAFDFDADGTPEIVVAAGMISEPADSLSGSRPDSRRPDLMSFFWRQVVAHSLADGSPSERYEQGWNAINQFIREGYSWNGHEPNVLYKRRGGRWIDFSLEVGLGGLDTRAFAAVDLNGDGRLDLLLKNRVAPQLTALSRRGEGGNVLVLELRGVESNRDAVGAWVTVESDNGVSSQLLSAGSGYLCQHTKRLHIGMGEATVARLVTIRWPSGKVEELRNLRAGRRYRVVEGRGVERELALALPGARAPELAAETAVAAPAELEDAWLLEAVPLPEELLGPGLVVIARGEPEAPLGVAPVERIDLDRAPPERAAWYALFQRYLFDYRGPLKVPPALLIDEASRVHKLYRSIPGADLLRADLKAMKRPDRLNLALPFAGWYSGGVPQRNLFRHGVAFYQAGYPEQALPYLDATLARSPDNFKARLAAGQIHLAAERLEAARPHIEAAVRLRPDSPEAWNNLGGLAMAEKNYAVAAECFDKALELSPDSTYATANAAQAYNRLGDARKAERLFRRTLKLAPEDADATNQLGLLLAKQDRFDEAKRLFERAIELRRDHVSAVNNLAVLYLRLNQPSEAVAALRYGIRVSPEAPDSYMNLARVYVRQGERGQARAVLERLLAAVPGSELGLRALAELDRP